MLVDSGATILEAHGSDPWFFRLRFGTHEGLTTFHNRCSEEGITFHVERIYALDEQVSGKYDLDLTMEQTEALMMAIRRGYFEVPRRITLGEIAEELGISQQAASERVRRAANQVLRRTLLTTSADDLAA